MKVDLVAADRALILVSCAEIKKALQNAATAARRVAHDDSLLTTDINHIERFEKAYKAKSANAEGETGKFVGTLDVPNEQCRVVRQGVLIIVERYGNVEHGLQEHLDLNDTKLRDRLGDMRDLGQRFGGQPSMFASAEAQALSKRLDSHKRELTGTLGLSAAESNGKPAKKRSDRAPLVHKKKAKGEKSSAQLSRKKTSAKTEEASDSSATPPAPFEQ